MVNNDRENIVENDNIILFQYIFGEIDKTLPELRLHKYNSMTANNKKTTRPEYLPQTRGCSEILPAIS